MRHARLLSLDAMRGVAALAVLVHHAERELHVGFGFAYGYLAVDIFFLMSGFVIAAAYEPRMDARMPLWAFLKLRLVRLYPMILLGALLGIAVAAVHGTIGPTLRVAALSALTMLPLIWAGDLLFPVNIPEWSLFFEIVTNFFHRIVAGRLSRRVLVAILAISFVLLMLAGWRLRGLANGFSPATFWGGFPRAFLSYFGGVLLYRMRGAWAPHVPRVPLPLLLAAFLAVVVGEAAMGGRVPASAYWLAAVLFVFPTLLMLLAEARVPAGMARAAEALGDLSYPLYAVHMPLLLLVAPTILRFAPERRAIFALLVTLLIAGIALLLDRIYDRPVRRGLQSRSRTPSSPAAEIAAP